MDNASEPFMHLVQTDAVLVLFSDTAGKNRSAGVLVASPYYFSLPYDSLSSSLVVFNSLSSSLVVFNSLSSSLVLFDGHAYECSLPTNLLLMQS